MADVRRCEEVRELLPELAAGVMSGDDRADALAHLGGCASCRRELAGLSNLVDRLVLLAPEREPSPGFESSVLSALAPEARPARRRRTLLLAAATLVLAIVLASVVAWWRTSDGPLVAAITYAGGETVGEAVVHEGAPPWLFLTVDSSPEPGRYRVRLVNTDGRRVYVGWCLLRGGRGSWGWPVDAPPGRLREVQLVRSGTVVMGGTFR